jgi:hypothetical protein
MLLLQTAVGVGFSLDNLFDYVLKVAIQRLLQVENPLSDLFDMVLDLGQNG